MPPRPTAESASTEALTSTTPARAAFQGIAGAFGDEAIDRMWQGRVQSHPQPTFEAALDAVLCGDVEWAVLPVHNSTIGAIEPACRALAERERSLECVDELTVPVRHCLLALPDTPMSHVRHVGSHPAALAQCARFFHANPGLSAREAFDTAGAACELAEFDRRSPGGRTTWYAALGVSDGRKLAVLAGERAATRYGLVVLRKAVQDRADNATRFVVVRAAHGGGR